MLVSWKLSDWASCLSTASGPALQQSTSCVRNWRGRNPQSSWAAVPQPQRNNAHRPPAPQAVGVRATSPPVRTARPSAKGPAMLWGCGSGSSQGLFLRPGVPPSHPRAPTPPGGGSRGPTFWESILGLKKLLALQAGKKNWPTPIVVIFGSNPFKGFQPGIIIRHYFLRRHFSKKF